MVNRFQSQVIASKSWYIINHIYPVSLNQIMVLYKPHLPCIYGPNLQMSNQLSKPNHYIKIMELYKPHLSCIYGPNLQMSNREQIIR